MSTISRSPLSSQTTQSPSPSPSPVSPLRKKMSITQTYYLAHTARGKLSSEAARSDHNLRLLVGHANLLDSLMLELAEAEQEQESWFNQSVRKATKQEDPRHIQWADTVVEEPEEDWETSDLDNDDSSDSDSDYDSDEEMEEPTMVSLSRVPSQNMIAPVTISSREVEEEDEEEFEDDGEEDYPSLQLHLTKSHSVSHPPELDHDSDESSEDESMPPSPPSDAIPSFSEKQQIATASYYSKSSPSSSIPQSEQQTFFDEGFYLPRRQSPPSLISAISVY